jgi:hypothetical protein
MNYYFLISEMKQHGYSIPEIEDLIPFERDIYVGLIEQRLERQQKMLEQ